MVEMKAYPQVYTLPPEMVEMEVHPGVYTLPLEMVEMQQVCPEEFCLAFESAQLVASAH
jgi:hypothetical protein